MNNIHLIDREDQLVWLVDPHWSYFCLNVERNHRQIMKWLEECTSHRVVICGGGKIPAKYDVIRAEGLFGKIADNVYKIYFEDDDEAMLFKLTWGGK